MSIRLDTGTPSEKASWRGLRDLSMVLPNGWSLAGGSLVRLHALERGAPFLRSTNDIDLILDIRQHSGLKYQVGPALRQCGFKVPVPPNPSGKDHRWIRPEAGFGDVTAVIDVLAPSFLGERTLDRSFPGVGKLLATRGAQFGLDRVKTVTVDVDEQFEVAVHRPDLVGALYAKSSALLNTGDADKSRHYEDIDLLAGLAEPADLQAIRGLRARQLRRLRNGLHATIAHVGPGGGAEIVLPSVEYALRSFEG